jgi:hypothetical protein
MTSLYSKQPATKTERATDQKAAETGERTYTLSVNDEGAVFTPVETTIADAIKEQTRPDVPAKSPFSMTEAENMRRYPQVKEQFTRLRPQDVLAHGAFMRARGPEVEKALGVSAKKIFLQGDSRAAAKLQKENYEGYRFLREYATFVK